MSSSQTLLALATGISWLVSIAGNVGLLVVALVLVRRHRPDAAGPLVGWAVAQLALGVLGAGLVPITTALAARGGGVEAIVTAQAVQTLLRTVLGAGLVVWLGYALVTLARPPSAVMVPREPPYR
jgi:hypothetical protein